MNYTLKLNYKIKPQKHKIVFTVMQ